MGFGLSLARNSPYLVLNIPKTKKIETTTNIQITFAVTHKTSLQSTPSLEAGNVRGVACATQAITTTMGNASELSFLWAK